MVKITELQNLLLSKDFWKERNVLTLVGMSGSGISTVLRDLVKQESEVTYVYVDMYDMGEVNDYNAIRHIAKSIKDNLVKSGRAKAADFLVDAKDFYTLRSGLLAKLEETSSPKKIVLILDNFESSQDLKPHFFNFLRELIFTSLKKPAPISVLFASDKYLDYKEGLSKFAKLYPILFNNLVHVSGFDVSDVSEVLKSDSKGSSVIANQIISLSAGNPKLVDRLLEYYAIKSSDNKAFEFTQLDNENILIEDKEILYTVNSIFRSLTKEQKEVLRKGLRGEQMELHENDIEHKYLIEVNIIAGSSLNMGLIKSFLSEEPVAHRNVMVTPTVQAQPVAKSGEYNTDSLSSQEFSIFQLLKKNKGKVVTKDEIAKLMWGKKEKSKQRDWAIDQLMKRLRNKIGDGKGSSIQTIRGRGYRFVV